MPAPLPPPPPSVTARQHSSAKSTVKTSTVTKRPGSAASVRRPPSTAASQIGTPKVQPNGVSARVPASKARDSAAKESSAGVGSKTEVKPARRQSSVATGRDKPPSKDGTAQRNAKEVEGLRDYQLGDCLGRGAFGSVYRALNWSTGETVAIKQVSTHNLAPPDLTSIMLEIDLLKNLNHPNIVKYHGFVKSPENLYIILEYCENGSLHSICKNFGKFPENLVALYTAQVLQGLLFLHEQGVIHRDIKGANILTTKEGLVKLADFGVATKTTDGSSVVGTPYWMAPEVIELSGASTASDIWSLGCTVIELLDGKPPYHKFAPMPALFRIVNDDHPPLPEGVSPLVRDFLLQCFQKDPNLRVSAKKLLRHPWILGSKKGDGRKAVKHEEAVELVEEWNAALKFSPRAEVSGSGRKRSLPKPLSRPGSRAKVPVMSGVTGKRNETLSRPGSRATALDGKRNHEIPSAAGGAARNVYQLLPKRDQQKQSANSYASPDEEDKRDNWDDDFESLSSTFKALQLPDHRKGQDNFAGLFTAEKLKRYATEPLPEMDGKVEQWDEEFPVTDEEMTIRSPLRFRGGVVDGSGKERKASKDSQPRTQILRPTQKAADGGKSGQQMQDTTKKAAPSVDRDRYREDEEEDYSDLVAEDESAFQQKLAGFSPSRAYSPKDIRTISAKLAGHSIRGARRRTHTPTNLVHDAAAMKRTRSSLEIQKYAEDEGDEDFLADVDFGDAEEGTPMQLYAGGLKQRSPQSVSGGSNDSLTGGGGSSENGTLRLGGTGLSAHWLNNDEDEEGEDEDDPFAALEEELDAVDLESNVARDKHARLCMQVECLVSELKVSQPEDVLMDIVDQLSLLLAESLPDVKNVIVASHGMLPILEILETCATPHTILSLLRIVNYIISENVEVQENLCFVGGIPIVTKFAHKRFSSEIRLEAAGFVRMMYLTSTLTLQMFVSCGGLNVLVEFLEEDYESEAGRELVLLGVNGIWSVFELQGPTPKNDFCRIFSRSSVLYPLSLVLSRILEEAQEGDQNAQVSEGRIVNIFLLFSQAENHVKETVADRMVLKRVLKDLKRMTPAHQITMLKFIKNLSMLATTLDALQNSNAIEVLTDLLASSMKSPHGAHREVSNQVLNTMYNLCRLSKSRQEDAALNGLIPLLQRIVQTERPLKEFALPILCDMAHSGKVGRMLLWQNKGLCFYVKLLAEPYWAVQALDAIFVWLQEETHKVELALLSPSIDFTTAIVACFNESKADAFEGLLEPLQKLLRLSRGVAENLAGVRVWFERCRVKMHARKPLVRLNLLRILRCLCEAHEEQGALLRRYHILDLVNELARNDQAILVREMAKSVLELGEERTNARVAGMRRSSSSVAMTPSTLGSSLPPTPGDRAGSRGGFFDYGFDGAGLRSRPVAASSPYRPESRGAGISSSGSLPPTQQAAVRTATSTTRLHPLHQRASIATSASSRLSLATTALSERGSGLGSRASRDAIRDAQLAQQLSGTPTHVPAHGRTTAAAVVNARRRRQTSGAELVGGRGL
ncbi:hypothetical protein LTR62_002106 [Meristemomyces frigidus]|uniref:non-specific serine/threonine protein kinase n=1 Tax=Meristemomyces frigidus TaxID=1508187 RepID=A0AAN7T8R9_9PEZI|nr:hypothetical protein LTR62_002106 [Meristemomyces frigidus]